MSLWGFLFAEAPCANCLSRLVHLHGCRDYALEGSNETEAVMEIRELEAVSYEAVSCVK